MVICNKYLKLIQLHNHPLKKRVHAKEGKNIGNHENMPSGTPPYIPLLCFDLLTRYAEENRALYYNSVLQNESILMKERNYSAAEFP